MDDTQRERLGLLLEQTLALPTVERRAFLEDACDGDATLLRELTSLLVAAESSSDYFDEVAERVILPAFEAAAGQAGSAGSADAEGRGNGDTLPPGTVVTHYEILERVGSGMGVVYRARDVVLGRTVALKFLPQTHSDDEHARERLYAEARAASALDHPGIGTVYEIGEAEQGGLFIALAWYEGETLKQRLTQGPLSVDDTVGVAREIASALAASHVAGIVHRDVKPSNVICTRQGVKLVDFGIAKVAGADLTRESATLGTVAYMSPEQTRGDRVDAPTDLWSLGVVMYEMLVGRRPFGGESDATLIHAIRHDEPASLHGVRPDLPPPLVRIVEQCLAKDPSERYARAEEMVEELDVLSEKGGSAPPGSVAEVARHGAGRAIHRPLRAAAVAAAVAALALVGYVVLSNGTTSDAPPPTAAASSGAALDPRPALAVLPFENRSGRPEDGYFADGLQDEIRTRLSGIASLRVTSRTSVMQYRNAPRNVRQIGRELGVSHVLEGSIQRAGNAVRLFVRLVDARGDAQIWSQSYDAVLAPADLFAVRAEVAERVAEALSAELTEAERARVAGVPTTDLEAWRHYMLGRHHWNRRNQEGMDSAYAHFHEAIRRDSSFARAYAGLADVHVLGYGPQRSKGRRLAIEAARTAIRLDPDLPEAHTSLGFALEGEWDWAGAEREFLRAIELDPSYATAHQWYAEFLVSQGRMDEAVKQARMAESLDPLSPIIGWNVSRILGFARRYGEELAQLRALAPLYPGDDRVITSLVISLMGFGHYAEAAHVLEPLAASMMEQAGSEGAERLQSYVDAIRAGRGEGLWEFFRNIEPAGTSNAGHRRMFAALELALAGDMDGAVRIIEESQGQREFAIAAPDLVAGWYFDPFRDDKRFNDALRHMGLDPAIGIQLRDRDPRWPPRR